MIEGNPFGPGAHGRGIGAVFRSSPFMWTILAVNVAYFLVLEAAGGSEDRQVLIDYGAKYGPGIADGQFWRLITPVFMHIGVFHLLANSVSLVIFGGIVERTFGWQAFLAIYLAAGVAGNVASYAAGPTVGAGASGAIFGMLGAFAIYLYFNRALFGASARGSLGGMAFIIGINILFGLTQEGIDNWAHLGGLLGGAVLALRLSPRVVKENTYGLNRRLLFARPVARRVSSASIASATTAVVAVLAVITVVVARDGEERNADLVDQLIGRAQEALLTAQFEEARILANEAIRADPRPEALGLLYLWRGLAAMETGDRQAAIRDLTLAQEFGLSAPESRALAQSALRDLGAN